MKTMKPRDRLKECQQKSKEPVQVVDKIKQMKARREAAERIGRKRGG